MVIPSDQDRPGVGKPRTDSQRTSPTLSAPAVTSVVTWPVARRHPAVGRLRLVVEREGDLDRMTLHCEVATSEDGLAPALEASLRSATGLRGAVQLVAPGTLANDGKVIDDRREPG